jgi:hypothetical protein
MTASSIQAQAVQAYVDAVFREENYTIPEDPALRGMSVLLDLSAKRAFEASQEVIGTADTIVRAVEKLKKAPRTVGKMTPGKTILNECTPYEQMAAVALWLNEKGPTMTKRHTVALGGEDDAIIPLYVNKPKNGSVSLMTTVVGHTRGRLKAPRYTELAETDPRGSAVEEFIEPLNGLEIQRQPNCIASLLLKSNGYDCDCVPNDWRYKVFDSDKIFAKEASVELPRQSSNKTTKVKEQSAGYNVAKMINLDPLRENNILPEHHYEDYHEEGYDDDATPEVTPLDILKGLRAIVKKKDSSMLDEQMARLFATRMGISESATIKQHVATILFEE